MNSAVHYFNERGMSVLTEDHLQARISELEAEVAELKRRNRSLVLRLRASAESDEPTALNS